MSHTDTCGSICPPRRRIGQRDVLGWARLDLRLIQGRQVFAHRARNLGARRRGCDTGALALAWVMNHAQVTAAICGPSRRAEYLGLARQSLTIELDESMLLSIACENVHKAANR